MNGEFLKRLKKASGVKSIRKGYAPGHFYSPIPNKEDLYSLKKSVGIQNLLDIDLNRAKQFELIKEFREYEESFSYPYEKEEENRYYLNNQFFIKPDAFALYCFIKHYKPKNIIEVGSGFSSAFMLDVNEKEPGNRINLNFIEPNPERLNTLVTKDENCFIHKEKVQNIDLSFFKQLNSNDILFIDSSHVSKLASDVNFLFFNVFPVLKSGVIIHLHDITWPFEYPVEWTKEGRYWNELYLLRAFLMNNNNYEVLLFNNYLANEEYEVLKENLPSLIGGGGSFYMRKR